MQLNEAFPCATCGALCCGPSPLSRDRMEKILGFVKAMPKAERKRLAKQKRGLLDCGFLDMKSHRCAIYSVRPWVCEMFGRVEGMPCPKLSRLVNILPPFLVETGFNAECESGIVGDSGRFNWLNCLDTDRQTA